MINNEQNINHWVELLEECYKSSVVHRSANTLLVFNEADSVFLKFRPLEGNIRHSQLALCWARGNARLCSTEVFVTEYDFHRHANDLLTAMQDALSGLICEDN